MERAAAADGPDVFAAEFQEDPFPVYARLRRESPVYREPRHGAWLLTRFVDVERALLDPVTFSSAHGPGPMPGGLAQRYEHVQITDIRPAASWRSRWSQRAGYRTCGAG